MSEPQISSAKRSKIASLLVSLGNKATIAWRLTIYFAAFSIVRQEKSPRAADRIKGTPRKSLELCRKYC